MQPGLNVKVHTQTNSSTVIGHVTLTVDQYLETMFFAVYFVL